LHCACNRKDGTLLIDRERVAAQASPRQRRALAFSDILPLASPGILRKAPRWLLDPLGPLAIRPSYLPHLAPWLFRFWRASQRDRVRASTAAQAAMMDLSATETPLMLAGAGASHMLRSDGVLHLYESDAELRRHGPDGRPAPTTASRSRTGARRQSRNSSRA
jgi:D-amino-acid dehydrogenase